MSFCGRCELCKGLPPQFRHPTEGVGNPHAEIMFVGEAPGYNEMVQGQPFVGRAGKVLDKMLSVMGLWRADVRLENAVRCKPPDNRDPNKHEMVACKPYLDDTIVKLKPKLIVTLGHIPLETLLGFKTITAGRGVHKLEVENRSGEKHVCWCCSTYHPAAVSRNWGLLESVLCDIERFLTFKDQPITASVPPFQPIYRILTVEDMVKLAATTTGRIFSLDLETTGFHWRRDKILCAGFCDVEVSLQEMVYILPLHGYATTKLCTEYWTPEDKAIVLAAFKKFLSNNRFFGHNIKFDFRFLLAQLGVELDIEFDTMLAHHTLDENSPHDIYYCAATYLGIDRWDNNLKAYLPNSKVPYSRVPNVVLWEYLSKDVASCKLLREVFLRRLKKENLLDFYKEFVVPMITALVHVESRGILLDLSLLDVLSEQLTSDIEDKTEQLFKLTGKFNYRSVQQLRTILFEQLHFPTIKKTPTGAPSTDKEILERYQNLDFFCSGDKTRFREAANVPRLLLELRGLENDLSRFKSDAGLKASVWADGRIHSNFNIHGTRNGRLSSSEPNIHTLPRAGALEGMARLLFTAPKDWKILEADYSQAELRVAAWLSQDYAMCESFRNKKDIHVLSASAMYNKPPEEITDDERYLAKFINFGLLYGRGYKSLAEQFKVSEQQAQEYIARYFKLYEGLNRWIDDLHEHAKALGELRNVFGRRRTFPGHISDEEWELSEIERQAVNFPCASTVSDCITRSTIMLDKVGKQLGLRGGMTMSLHDSIFIESPPDEIRIFLKLIRCFMLIPVKGDFAIPVDVKIGPRWGDAEEKHSFSEGDYIPWSVLKEELLPSN